MRERLSRVSRMAVRWYVYLRLAHVGNEDETNF